ncbi:MAG: hypothetical protein WC876_03605 [Candidatus Thermoplasmatota archaeon]|jgi:hypothetical protein
MTETEGLAVERVPQWSAWSSGMLLVAGILHLTMLNAHLQQARGMGLYFLAVGAAQVIWACLALFRPSQLASRVGLALLAVAPVALWALTRLFRSPWGIGPEPVDFVSVSTVLLELAAAIVLVRGRAGLSATDAASPRLARRTITVLVVIGLALGAASYGGAIAAEASIPWLGEGESGHHDEAQGESLQAEEPLPADDGHAH